MNIDTMNLQILFLGESENNAKSVEKELIKNKLNLTFQKVNIQNGYLASLNNQWDFILSDYNDKGLNALYHVRKNNPDIPFIFLSDVNDESVASKAIKLGATDYILRPNLICLSHAIKRELRFSEIKKEKDKVIDELIERKRIEEDLKSSRRKYKDIFDFAPVGIFQVLNDGTIVTANKAIAHLLGFPSVEEFKKNNIKDFYLNEEDRDALIYQAERYGQFRNKVVSWKKKDGSHITIEMSGHIAKSDNFTLYHEAFVRDITEEKKSEKALRDSQRRFKDLADLLPQTIFETDYFGKLTFANKRGLSLFGYVEEDLNTNINVFQLILESEKENAKRKLLLKYNGEKTEMSEYTAVRKDGSTFPCLIFSTPIFEDNKVKGLRGILIDITDRKKTLEDLMKSKEKAEEANRLKTAFLSSMSHEIRTPLNAIMGIVEILKDEYYKSADEDLKDLFGAMSEASSRLLNTITQILDISRLEAKEFEINLEKLSINKTAAEIVNMLKTTASAKGLNLILDVPDHDVHVKADSYCLNGVFLNLLSNSIKYSNKGEIKVKIMENGKYIYCDVVDEGIGMSEEYQKHLFEIFSQEDVGASRRYEGTGLGLAITKKYLQIMNGDIKIESKKNSSTKVTFWLQKN